MGSCPTAALGLLRAQWTFPCWAGVSPASLLPWCCPQRPQQKHLGRGWGPRGHIHHSPGPQWCPAPRHRALSSWPWAVWWG